MTSQPTSDFDYDADLVEHLFALDEDTSTRVRPTRRAARARADKVAPPGLRRSTRQPGRRVATKQTASPRPVLRVAAPVREQTPPRIRPSTRGRLVAGSLALTGAVVTLVVGAFVVLQAVFPWMTLFDHDAVATPPPLPRVVDARAIADLGPSLAEQVVTQVIGTDPGTFGAWTASKVTSTVSAPSLGFGCDPTDGLSPVVGRSRSWVRGSGTTAADSVTLSVRAYPAGGGAVALDGIAQAAVACEAASLGTAGVDVGVEAVTISSRRSSALVWRRGDVLVIAAVEAHGLAGSPSVYADALHQVDDALDAALVGPCLDPQGTTDQATRSPYLNRDAYLGHHVNEEVRFVRSSGMRRAERTTRDPVVKIPSPTVAVPVLDTLPAPLVPTPTSGPTALPAAVAPPVVPQAPSKPTLAREVQRGVEDTTGPGCGWAFTAQQIPPFDATKAASLFEKDVSTAEHALDRTWTRWQKARVAYYRHFARYLDAAADYRHYAHRIAKISAAWNVIAVARDAYTTAYAAWQDAMSARSVWQIDHDQAKVDYQAAKATCHQQNQEPTDPPSATEPTSDPSTAPTPSASPSAPTVQCPPQRPTILDEDAPSVVPKPSPDPQAQLPAPRTSP